MVKQLHFKSLLLLFAMIVGSTSVWAQAEETIASFTASTYNGGTTNGWTVTDAAAYATAGGGYYQLTSSDYSIVTPTINWSGYTNITITIGARKFGGPNETQGKISVSQGDTELASYSPSGTSIVSSSALSITPTDGAITISCPGASSNKGCGVQSITIKGTVANPNPVLAVNPYTKNVAYEGATGTLDVVATNFLVTDATDCDFQFFADASGESSSNKPSWISLSLKDSNSKLEYTVVANDGEARTAYFKMYMEVDGEGLYSDMITINQAAYVVDFATLPFNWNGGTQSELTGVTGVTANGLGGDYAESYVPYRVKFDGNGDYIQVKTDSQPGKVTIGVKMIGGGSTSTITVQGSANGTDFNDVQDLTISGSQNDVLTLETTSSFAATDRYVRLYFTKGSNVGVGPISIAKPSNSPEIVASNVNIAYDATSGSIAYTINNPVDGGVLTASSNANWLTPGTVANGTVPFTVTANEGLEREATVTLTYTYGDNEPVTKNVTVTQAQNPNAAGTENNPYTVTQARNAIDAETGITGVYVTGTVSEIVTEFSSQYGNISYNISVDGTTTAAQLLVFRCKSYNGANFTSAEDIQVGDVVVVNGDLQLYYDEDEDTYTYEFKQGCKLISLERNEIEYYLTGTFNSWSETLTEMQKLEKNSEGKYATPMNVTIPDGSTFTEFKVIRKNLNGSLTWIGAQADGSYYLVFSDGDIQMNEGGGQNLRFETAGEYTFTFDVSTYKLNVTGFPVPEVKYYLAGSWSDNWSDGKIELDENADGTFSTSKLVGPGTRFKFVKTVDGVEHWLSANKTGDDYGVHSEHYSGIQLVDNNNNAAFVIQIAADATLSFTLNPTTMKFDVAGWPITADGNMFVKVTSGSVGDGAYLIVYKDGNLAFDGSKDASSIGNGGNHIDVTIVNNRIVANETTKASLFFIQNGTIKSASGLYIGRTSNSNGLDVSDETVYTNTISIDSEGNAVINSSGNAYLRFNTASGGMFRYYKSTSYTDQEDIQLYKLVTIEPETVAITSAGMATYYSENPLDFSGFEDMWAYTAAVTPDGAITYTRIIKVPALTAVVLYNQNGGAASHEVPVCTESTDSVSTNNLIGVLEYYTVPQTEANGATNYLLNKQGDNVGFYKASGRHGVAAHRAYLQVPAGTTVRSFYGFNEGGVSTGIEELNSESTTNNRYYNLNGQQTVAPQKGLYIVNGKKVMVK